MRLPVNQPRALGLIALAATVGVLGVAATPLLARPERADLTPATGPAADYPMVIGAPYTVDGATFTPADVMNYDQVGYAVSEPQSGAGVSIAHRTLPLPSYVEVTSLKTGRTILARVERRGPMAGPNFIGLSPAAAAQLGSANEGPDSRTPVRVRRVNPPEQERALLRTGQTAPVRMDTPMSLVGVLLRKLDPALAPPPPAPETKPSVVAAPVPTAARMKSATPTQKPAVSLQKPAVAPALRQAGSPAARGKPPVGQPGAHAEPATKPALSAAPKPLPTPKAPPLAPAAKPEPKPEPMPQAKPAAKSAAGKVVVQVGAFSNRANAETAARQVGGTVTPAGKLFRVRIGAFAAPAQAAAALAKAKGAGYSDARIQRAD